MRHVCPDTCRRGGWSRYMDGPIYCSSCIGVRIDLLAEIAIRRERVAQAYAWENAWAEAHGASFIEADNWPQ